MAELAHFHFKEVESTQTEAFKLIESDTPRPFYVTADIQTKGRGRQGRLWHMEAGRSLAMSLAVTYPVKKLEGLSLIVGLAIVEALGRNDLKLKWPNDIMLNDKKVGGILIESRSFRESADIVIGVGLNLLSFENGNYSSLDQSIDTKTLALNINDWVRAFIQTGFATHASLYDSLLWKKGEFVDFVISGEKRNVKILGISSAGHLQTEEGSALTLNIDGEICLE